MSMLTQNFQPNNKRVAGTIKRMTLVWRHGNIMDKRETA